MADNPTINGTTIRAKDLGALGYLFLMGLAKQDGADAVQPILDGLAALAPITSIVAVTPGNTAFAASRALIASADMTANLTVGGVDIDNVPLNKGINSIAATRVRAVSAGSVLRAN